MIFRNFGSTGLKVSAIGLGGHEFGDKDFIRGFGDDSKLAVTRGYIFDGFGGDSRRSIVKKAIELGINLFDVTIDSEKEAIGRILEDLDPGGELLIQTRPEGMVYTYDPDNRQMAQYDLVRDEARRICSLLRRDRIDILNFAFMKEAIEADPHYLEKISDVIARLKSDGLIRFASADTFSGEATYLRQYATGAFDTTFINYNYLETAMEDQVIPEASRRGMAILTREAFMKARLFGFAEAAGFTDRSSVAKTSIKWVLSNEAVSAAIIGVSSPEQLADNCSCLDSPGLDEGEMKMIEAITSVDEFDTARKQKQAAFKGTL